MLAPFNPYWPLLNLMVALLGEPFRLCLILIGMNAGEYRAKAIGTIRRSELVRDGSLKQALVDLALVYLKLARRAEKNVMTDVVYETPPPRPTHTH